MMRSPRLEEKLKSVSNDPWEMIQLTPIKLPNAPIRRRPVKPSEPMVAARIIVNMGVVPLMSAALVLVVYSRER